MLAPFQELKVNKQHEAFRHTKLFNYQRAQLLTLTSSSTMHRPRCVRSQTSSGYIAIRLERYQGHSTRSPVDHSDELIYSAQATLPQKSDQLRLHRHSARMPPRGPVAHSDELLYSTQATLPQESNQLRLHRHSARTPPRGPVAHSDELIYSA